MIAFGGLLIAGIPVALAMSAVFAALGLTADPRRRHGDHRLADGAPGAARPQVGGLPRAHPRPLGHGPRVPLHRPRHRRRLGLRDLAVGVGLATASLLDATLVRAVLLPATMKLLGDRNWYLPKKLSWLPRVSHGTPALGS